MPWFGAWGSGPWFIFPMLMCIGMMVMMMLMMGRGHMGDHMMGRYGGGHVDEPPVDPALETLRQRFASGEITRQEYEEQRNLLLRV